MVADCVYFLIPFDLYLSQRVSPALPVEIWQVCRSLVQDQLPLEAMGSVRGPHPCAARGVKALLKASAPCCGAADTKFILGNSSFPRYVTL